MIRYFVFAIGSVFLVYVSRKTLFHLHSHGSYRFIAWECILALIVLNFPYWEIDPLSPHQLFSWLFLLISIFLVIHGVRLLKRIGKPDENRPDNELLEFEKTTQLVTVGAYKYIRHPLYSSLLFLAWGGIFQATQLIARPAVGFDCIPFSAAYGKERRIGVPATFRG